MTREQFATDEMREKLAQLNGEERFAAEYAALLHPIVYMDWLKQLFVKEFCGEDEAEAEKRWTAAVDKLNELQILYRGEQAGLAKMKSGAAIPLLCALGGRKGKMLAKLAKQIEESIFYFFSTDDEEMYYALQFVSDWIDENSLTEKHAVLLESAAENFDMSFVDAPRGETSKLFFETAEKLIDRCSQDTAKNAAVLCRLYRAVGTMNSAMGNLLKCIEMKEKALAAGRKYLGEKDETTLDCMRNLAYSCSRAGMAERGAELLEKRLNIYKDTSGAGSKAVRRAEKDFNEFCAEMGKKKRMGSAEEAERARLELERLQAKSE